MEPQSKIFSQRTYSLPGQSTSTYSTTVIILCTSYDLRCHGDFSAFPEFQALLKEKRENVSFNLAGLRLPKKIWFLSLQVSGKSVWRVNRAHFSKISQSLNLLGEYLRALENDIDSLGKHKCKPFVKNETEEQFYNLAEKFN